MCIHREACFLLLGQLMHQVLVALVQFLEDGTVLVVNSGGVGVGLGDILNFDHFLDLVMRMHDSGMISAAEHFADIRERCVNDFTNEMHCDLAR